MMKNIQSEIEYDAALRRAKELMNTEAGSPEGIELDMLITLIERY